MESSEFQENTITLLKRLENRLSSLLCVFLMKKFTNLLEEEIYLKWRE